MLGRVYRDGFSLSWQGRYAGWDTVSPSRWGRYIGRDTVHYDREGIQEWIQSVMVGKVYRRRHYPSWWGRYSRMEIVCYVG